MSGVQRIEQLRQGMRERGIEALLCMKPPSFFYLSGFNPIVFSQPVAAILSSEGDPVLLVHALRDDHARHSSWVKDIRLYGAWSTKKTMGLDWLAALRTILEERDLLKGRLGIDGDFLPARILSQLQSYLPEAQFEDASELILESRMVKDDAEIQAIRAAARIADIGMEAAVAAARSRKNERAIAVEGMAAMNQAWLKSFPDVEVADFGGLEVGVPYGLWCIVLSGDHVLFNGDNPMVRELSEGELGFIVAQTVCDGMHAENERAIAVGEVDRQRREAYEAVLRVWDEAMPAIRPGVTCSDVFNVAREVYERIGYEKYLPGRIGHGIGLGAHELPSFAPGDQTVLRKGLVMTVEPNLRIPEFGGLQHSDTLVITEEGFEVLTKTPEPGYIRV